jgi:hypothetical protein
VGDNNTLKYDIEVNLAQLTEMKRLEESLQQQTIKVQQLTQAYDSLAEKMRKAASNPSGGGGGGSPFKGIEDGLKNLLGHVPIVGSALSHLSEPIGDVVKAFKDVSGTSGVTFGALAGGIAAVTAGIGLASQAVSEFAGYETRLARLDAVLANNGLLTDSYRAKLQSLANQMQDTTGITEEKWIGVLQRLTQYGVKPDKIDEYANAVKNLAGIMGGSVEIAGRIFTRIMNGQTQGLARFGLQLSHTGDRAKDFANAVKVINERGTGVRESELTTLNGLMTNLKTQTSDIFKGLGGQIAGTGIIQRVLTGWGMMAKWTKEQVSSIVPAAKGIENKGVTLEPIVGNDKEEMYEYGRAQTLAAQTTHQATAAIQEQRAALEQHYKAVKDMADAQKDLAMAKLDDMRLSPEEHARGKQAIEAAHEETVYKNETAKRTSELRSKENEVTAAGDASTRAFGHWQSEKARIDNRERDAAKLAETNTKIAALIKESKEIESNVTPTEIGNHSTFFEGAVSAVDHIWRGDLTPTVESTPQEDFKSARVENARREKRRAQLAKELPELQRSSEARAKSFVDTYGKTNDVEDFKRAEQARKAKDKALDEYNEAVRKLESTQEASSTAQANADAEQGVKLATRALGVAVEDEKIARETTSDKQKGIQIQAELVAKTAEENDNYQEQQRALDIVFTAKRNILGMELQGLEIGSKAADAKRAEISVLERENSIRKSGIADRLSILESEKKLAFGGVPKSKQRSLLRNEIKERLEGGTLEDLLQGEGEGKGPKGAQQVIDLIEKLRSVDPSAAKRLTNQALGSGGNERYSEIVSRIRDLHAQALELSRTGGETPEVTNPVPPLNTAELTSGITNVNTGTVTITTPSVTVVNTGGSGGAETVGNGAATETIQARATGGSAMAGTPYLVGEKGPEIFVPRQTGEVIPNHIAARMPRALQEGTEEGADIDPAAIETPPVTPAGKGFFDTATGKWVSLGVGAAGIGTGAAGVASAMFPGAAAATGMAIATAATAAGGIIAGAAVPTAAVAAGGVAIYYTLNALGGTSEVQKAIEATHEKYKNIKEGEYLGGVIPEIETPKPQQPSLGALDIRGLMSPKGVINTGSRPKWADLLPKLTYVPPLTPSKNPQEAAIQKELVEQSELYDHARTPKPPTSAPNNEATAPAPEPTPEPTTESQVPYLGVGYKAPAGSTIKPSHEVIADNIARAQGYTQTPTFTVPSSQPEPPRPIETPTAAWMRTHGEAKIGMRDDGEKLTNGQSYKHSMRDDGSSREFRTPINEMRDDGRKASAKLIAGGGKETRADFEHQADYNKYRGQQLAAAGAPGHSGSARSKGGLGGGAINYQALATAVVNTMNSSGVKVEVMNPEKIGGL